MAAATTSNSEAIVCVLENGDGGTLGIGRLSLLLPEWWDSVEPFPSGGGGYNGQLDRFIEYAYYDPNAVIKAAALTDIRYGFSAGILGQVLMELEQMEVAGCVLGAASASESVENVGGGYRMTLFAYLAGEAYTKAGNSDAATDWYSYAAGNPGGSSDADLWASESAKALE